jgi:hypothetical protein
MYEGSPHIWNDEGVARIGHDAPTAHLADLIDPGDPAFSKIMQAVLMFRQSDIEVTEAVVEMAVKIGRHRHAVEAEWDALPGQRPDVPGAVVYYIRRSSMIKIGTTVDLRARMAVLLPDEVMAIEPGSYSLEAARHRQFRKLRVRGQREWFHAGPLLQQHIMKVRSEHGEPDPTLPVLPGS